MFNFINGTHWRWYWIVEKLCFECGKNLNKALKVKIFPYQIWWITLYVGICLDTAMQLDPSNFERGKFILYILYYIEYNYLYIYIYIDTYILQERLEKKTPSPRYFSATGRQWPWGGDESLDRLVKGLAGPGGGRSNVSLSRHILLNNRERSISVFPCQDFPSALPHKTWQLSCAHMPEPSRQRLGLISQVLGTCGFLKGRLPLNRERPAMLAGWSWFSLTTTRTDN